LVKVAINDPVTGKERDEGELKKFGVIGWNWGPIVK
jgi:hypothetical protein